jgi:hypothetical protein
VDGTDRERFHAASVVVVAYRDTPDYVEGRRRWQSYLDEVLFARLHLGTDHHAPVASPYALPGAIGRSVERWLQRANRLAGAAQGKRAGSVDGVRPVSWYFTDMSG